MSPLFFLFSLTLSTALADTAPTPAVATLPNGLTVIVERQTRTDEVAMAVMYRVGSRDEQDGEHGYSRLIASAMEANAQRMAGDAFRTNLDGTSGAGVLQVYPDYTLDRMSFDAPALDRALFLISQRVAGFGQDLDEASLDHARLAVLATHDEPSTWTTGSALNALSLLLWPQGHPYAVPPIGSVADLQGAAVEPLREFWAHHYQTHNAVLIVVGNVDPAETIAKVTHWFSDVPDRGELGARPSPDVPADHTTRGYLYGDNPDRSSVHLAWPGVQASHSDGAALSVLGALLHDRLTAQTDDTTGRRRVYTAVHHIVGSQVGEFSMYAGSGGVTPKRMERLLQSALQAVIDEAPTPSEVALTQRAVSAEFAKMLADPSGRLSLAAYCWGGSGEPNCVERELVQNTHVSAADVQRVAATYLTPERMAALTVLAAGRVAPRSAGPLLEIP